MPCFAHCGVQWLGLGGGGGGGKKMVLLVFWSLCFMVRFVCACSTVCAAYRCDCPSIISSCDWSHDMLFNCVMWGRCGWLYGCPGNAVGVRRVLLCSKT